MDPIQDPEGPQEPQGQWGGRTIASFFPAAEEPDREEAQSQLAQRMSRGGPSASFFPAPVAQEPEQTESFLDELGRIVPKLPEGIGRMFKQEVATGAIAVKSASESFTDALVESIKHAETFMGFEPGERMEAKEYYARLVQDPLSLFNMSDEERTKRIHQNMELAAQSERQFLRKHPGSEMLAETAGVFGEIMEFIAVPGKAVGTASGLLHKILGGSKTVAKSSKVAQALDPARLAASGAAWSGLYTVEGRSAAAGALMGIAMEWIGGISRAIEGVLGGGAAGRFAGGAFEGATLLPMAAQIEGDTSFIEFANSVAEAVQTDNWEPVKDTLANTLGPAGVAMGIIKMMAPTMAQAHRLPSPKEAGKELKKDYPPLTKENASMVPPPLLELAHHTGRWIESPEVTRSGVPTKDLVTAQKALDMAIKGDISKPDVANTVGLLMDPKFQESLAKARTPEEIDEVISTLIHTAQGAMTAEMARDSMEVSRAERDPSTQVRAEGEAEAVGGEPLRRVPEVDRPELQDRPEAEKAPQEVREPLMERAQKMTEGEKVEAFIELALGPKGFKTSKEAEAAKAKRAVPETEPPLGPSEAMAGIGALIPGKVRASIRQAFSGGVTTDITKAGREIVEDYGGTIEAAKFETGRFAKRLDQRFPEELQTEMLFYAERTGNPSVPGDSFKKLEARLPKEARDMVNQELKPRMEEFQKLMEDVGLLEKGQGIEDYITHLWDIPTGQKAVAERIRSAFRSKTPFAKKRTIPTYFEGIKAGLTPRTTKISEILTYYENVTNQAIAGKELLRAISETDVGNVKLAGKQGQVPKDYVEIDHWAARGVLVHPEIAPALRKVFDNTFRPGEWRHRFQIANFAIKRLNLAWSGFHIVALGESALADSNAIRAGKAVKDLDNLLALGKDAVEHGLTLSVPGDIGKMTTDTWFRGQWRKWQESKEPLVKLLGKGAELLHRSQLLLDNVLWDKVYTSVKLTSFYKNGELALLDQKNWAKWSKEAGGDPARTRKLILREVADQVNDAYGGQNWWRWHKVMHNQGQRRTMQMLMLAPDWTLSNLRIAGRAIGGFLGVGSKTSQKFGRRYALNIAIKGFLAAEAAQYLWLKYSLTDEEEAELVESAGGLHIWNNEEFGTIRWKKDEEGQWLMIKPFKQVREVFQFFVDPIKKLGAKASPVVRMVFEQFASEDMGSGFPAPWEGQDFWDSVPERMKFAASNVIPFAWGGTQFAFVLPRGQEMTTHRHIEATTRLIHQYADPKGNFLWEGREMSPEEAVENLEEIANVATRNNIDPSFGLRIAFNEVRKDYFTRFMTALNEGDTETADKMGRALSKLFVKPRQAASTLQWRFLRLLQNNQAMFGPEEWKRTILPEALRKMDPSLGVEVEKHRRRQQKESKRFQRDVLETGREEEKAGKFIK